MSLLTIRTQVITEIGGRLDLNSVIDDQVNFAVREVSTMHPFEQLESTSTTPTVSAQSAYLLPADLFVLWTVKNETNNYMLEHKDIQAFDRIDETTTGRPNVWAQFNRTLILFNSVPDGVYSIRIRYWKKHGVLTADGDGLELPAEVERGIRLKATAFMFTILDQDEKAQAKHGEFDRWLERLKQTKTGSDVKNKTARLNFGVNK